MNTLFIIKIIIIQYLHLQRWLESHHHQYHPHSHNLIDHIHPHPNNELFLYLEERKYGTALHLFGQQFPQHSRLQRLLESHHYHHQYQSHSHNLIYHNRHDPNSELFLYLEERTYGNGLSLFELQSPQHLHPQRLLDPRYHQYYSHFHNLIDHKHSHPNSELFQYLEERKYGHLQHLFELQFPQHSRLLHTAGSSSSPISSVFP